MKWQLTTGRARIMAPPALVWQWVAEPRGWPAWNPKIEDIVPFVAEAPRAGWRFRIAYRLRKKKQLAEAELVEFLPNQTLACRTMGGDLKPGGETFFRGCHESLCAAFEVFQKAVNASIIKLGVNVINEKKRVLTMLPMIHRNGS